MRNRMLMFCVLGLTLGLAITSCSKRSAETPATPSSTTAPVEVSDVDLGRAVDAGNRVTEKVVVFQASDPIYASVVTNGSSPNTVLKARWTYQDGTVVQETEQVIAPTGNAATEFHIAKPDGWPVGKYKLEVFLDGRPVQTKEFEVK